MKAGTHIGPYRIISPVCTGGMGEVYRTTDGFDSIGASGKITRTVGTKIGMTKYGWVILAAFE